MAIAWESLLLGFCFGVPVSVLFFVSLAWSVQAALRSARPGVLLLLSSLCRIGVLMIVGLWVASAQGNVWTLAGYALAFFLVRLVAVLYARRSECSPYSSRRARNAAHTG